MSYFTTCQSKVIICTVENVAKNLLCKPVGGVFKFVNCIFIYAVYTHIFI